MIKDVYFQRHWAETVRLFIGWLDSEQSGIYIKNIAEKDILLASECRANLFGEDLELDDYLSRIALNNAREKVKTSVSARGLLALAVLERYDYMLKIFKSIRASKNTLFYSNVISDFIRNGSESQVIELLKILASSNSILFEAALDNILESSLVFSPDSKKSGLEILRSLEGHSNEIVGLKLICLFQLGNEIDDPYKSLLKLIEGKQILFALRLSSLTQITVDEQILGYLKDYVNNDGRRQLVRIFVNVFSNLKFKFDASAINIILNKSLNPVIKRMGLLTLSDEPISRGLALKLCEENIRIGNKSSIEFADEIIRTFDLNKDFSKEDLVLILLKSYRYQSIELAYKFIKQYSLYHIFNFRLVFNLTVGNTNPESLQFARKLVLEEFPMQERKDLLLYISVLSLQEGKPSRLTKQILLNDLNRYDNSKSLFSEHVGFVATYFKGTYQIMIGYGLRPIVVSAEEVRLRVGDFVKFRIIEAGPAVSESKIEIIARNILVNECKKFLFNGHHMGEIIKVKVLRIDTRTITCFLAESKLKYLIPISEISDEFVTDISRHAKVGEMLTVRIKDFNFKYGKVICSLKDLKFETSKLFHDKLKSLITKFSM